MRGIILPLSFVVACTGPSSDRCENMRDGAVSIYSDIAAREHVMLAGPMGGWPPHWAIETCLEAIDEAGVQIVLRDDITAPQRAVTTLSLPDHFFDIEQDRLAVTICHLAVRVMRAARVSRPKQLMGTVEPAEYIGDLYGASVLEHRMRKSYGMPADTAPTIAKAASNGRVGSECAEEIWVEVTTMRVEL